MFKGTEMKILSSFANAQVVPNLCKYLCSDKHKGGYFDECQ